MKLLLRAVLTAVFLLIVTALIVGAIQTNNFESTIAKVALAVLGSLQAGVACRIAVV